LVGNGRVFVGCGGGNVLVGCGGGSVLVGCGVGWGVFVGGGKVFEAMGGCGAVGVPPAN